MSGCLIKKLSASIGIIGAGAYGTALATTLARNGHLVLLWGYNKHISELKDSTTKCNATFLPNIPFSERIIAETNLAKIVNFSRDLIVVVPSHAFRDVIIKLKPYLRIDSRIIWGTKGLEKGTGRLLQDVAREILGNEIPLAIISGPTFAKELSAGLPTDIILASTDRQFAKDLQHKLHCDKSFRVYSSSDCIGVQLAGVIKNVIAISVGISDGIGFGSNSRMALITRGLAEMTQLGIVLGADPITFMGMAGLGDLVLTCTDNQSRNRRFGIMLGQGKSIKEAQRIIGQVVEGYVNNKEINLLAASVNVEMPISEQIYQVLYCQKSVTDAASSLLNC